MKVPVTIENVSLRVILDLPNTFDDIEYLKGIKEKLGSLSQGATVDALTKIIAGTITEISISSPNALATTQNNNMPPSLGDYTLEGGGILKGQSLKQVAPESLAYILQSAPYLLSDRDRDMIGGYLNNKPASKPPPMEVQSEIWEEDNIPW